MGHWGLTGVLSDSSTFMWLVYGRGFKKLVSKKPEPFWGKAMALVPGMQRRVREQQCHKHKCSDRQTGEGHGERDPPEHQHEGCGNRAISPPGHIFSPLWDAGPRRGSSAEDDGPTLKIVAARGARLLSGYWHNMMLMKGTRRVHSPRLIWTI